MRRGKRSKRFKDETGVKMTYRQEHSSEGFDVHSFIHKTQIFQKIRSGEGLEGGGGDLLVHIFTSTGIFKKMSTPSPFERGPTSPTIPLLHNYMCLIKPVVKHAYFAFFLLFLLLLLQHPQFVICNRLQIKRIFIYSEIHCNKAINIFLPHLRFTKVSQMSKFSFFFLFSLT